MIKLFLYGNMSKNYVKVEDTCLMLYKAIDEPNSHNLNNDGFTRYVQKVYILLMINQSASDPLSYLLQPAGCYQLQLPIFGGVRTLFCQCRTLLRLRGRHKT